MLAALAMNWPLLALRAAVAAIFGVAAILLPAITLRGLVMLFGAYAAVDGALALVAALASRGAPGFGRLLLEALVRIGVGFFAFLAPGGSAAICPASGRCRSPAACRCCSACCWWRFRRHPT